MFHRLAPLAILSIILGVAPLPLTMADSETGTINTLFIGDPFIQPGFPTPALIEDPKISLTRVVGELAFITKQEMTKAMRIYLPRTEEHLTERYDLVALAAIRSDHLSPAFEKWIGDLIWFPFCFKFLDYFPIILWIEECLPERNHLPPPKKTETLVKSYG